MLFLLMWLKLLRECVCVIENPGTDVVLRQQRHDERPRRGSAVVRQECDADDGRYSHVRLRHHAAEGRCAV